MHSNQTGYFSGNIQQRQPVHNGVSGSRWKLHWRRTNEEQNRVINNKVLPCTVGMTHGVWNSRTNNTHTWQQSIGSVQSRNKEKLQISDSTTRQPPTKLSGTSNTNIQEPLQDSNCRSWQDLPNKAIGQTLPTDRAHSQPTTPIKCRPHSVSISICSLSIRLQQNDPGTNGMRRPNPWT